MRRRVGQLIESNFHKVLQGYVLIILGKCHRPVAMFVDTPRAASYTRSRLCRSEHINQTIDIETRFTASECACKRRADVRFFHVAEQLGVAA